MVWHKPPLMYIPQWGIYTPAWTYRSPSGKSILSRARPGAPRLTEDERHGLVDYLARHPEKGDLIPGTGGLRKLRWSKGGRGKRSGYRAIYYFFSEDFPICLLAIYPKNRRVNLSAEQRKQLSAQADTLKEAFRATVRKRSIR